MVVLDTSVLLFWTLDRERLSQAAAQAVSEAGHIAVSSISIWEIGIKVKRGRLRIPLPIADFTARLQQIDRLDLLPVDTTTWLKNLDLDWDHRDPADRTIVATATLRNCPLVTSDATIHAYYPQAIW